MNSLRIRLASASTVLAILVACNAELDNPIEASSFGRSTVSFLVWGSKRAAPSSR